MTRSGAVDRIERADTVVVGSGVAGLATALGLRSATLLTAETLGRGGSTPLAQGRIAAAVKRPDTPTRHAADTVRAAAGLADLRAVECLTGEAPSRVAWLRRVGAAFDQRDGRLALGREGGHSHRRILHANGDATGPEVSRALTAAATNRPGLTIVEHAEAIDLVRNQGRVVGVVADVGRERVAFLARAVVLATGGVGGLYAVTTNPLSAQGLGIAMAARAGARLVDLEFVQFHPTALAIGGAPLPLLTEALRGEGAVLRNATGARFMLGRHPDAELAPRDIVARSIVEEQEKTGAVYLDATGAARGSFRRRFPTAWATAASAGLDPERDLLPVTPAAHYFMGGVAVDLSGRTSVPGLWVVGEASASGVHGANRLASNSLLEGLVFGLRAAASIEESPLEAPTRGGVPSSTRLDHAAEPELEAILRDTMWRHVGLVRTAAGLLRAHDTLAALERESRSFRTRAAVSVARLITLAAARRRESRGCHYRSDYPDPDPAQAKRQHATPIRTPLTTSLLPADRGSFRVAAS